MDDRMCEFIYEKHSEIKEMQNSNIRLKYKVNYKNNLINFKII